MKCPAEHSKQRGEIDPGKEALEEGGEIVGSVGTTIVDAVLGWFISKTRVEFPPGVVIPDDMSKENVVQ